MQCPSCQEKLVRAKYADANVHECSGCGGMLLPSTRSKKIEKRVNKDIEALFEEVANSSAVDIEHVIRCPACRDRMKKVSIKTLGFHVDDCNQCGLSWFDGGELAALQLAFENREQTVELKQMRERIENMTDAEREEYENRIASLKELGTSGEQALAAAAFRLQYYCWWRSYFRSL